MKHQPTPRFRVACAAAAAALSLVACGGGSGEAPPQPGAPSAATTAPVVTITKSTADSVATGPVTFTFSFNRDVGTTFTADDVTVTDGTKGTFTRVNGTSATLVVTPPANAEGTMRVSIAANAASDSVGNGNAATSAEQAFRTLVQTVVVNFSEATPPVLTGFGGAEDATVVTDPTDGGNKVARIIKSATAEVWAGTTVSICPNQALVRLPFSATNTTMSARVWSPVAGVPVRMKVEDAADNTKSVETEATTTVANAWQTLVFNFANAATGTPALNVANTYNKASIFFNFGTGGAATGARTYYLDDLAFRGSSFAVACPAPPPPPAGAGTVLANFDDVSPPVAGFEGAEGSAIENGPAGGGSGRSFKVLRSGGQVFALGIIETSIPITATRRTISAQVFSPTAGIPMVMKIEGPGGANSGDVAANEPVVVGWQTLTWTFTNANPAQTYNKIVLLPNLGTVDAPPGKAYFFDSITLRDAATAPPAGTTLANFDDVSPPVAGFEGAEGSAVENGPAGGGSGRSFKVLRSGGQVFALGIIETTVPITASRRTISAQVFSPTAGIPMVMKIEGPGGANSGDVAANEPVVVGWQTLTWTFTNANPAQTYNKIVLLPNLGTVDAPPGKAYFFDNIVLQGASTAPPSAGPLTFSTGFAAGNRTVEGGEFGGFSGSNLDNFGCNGDPANCGGGGEFAPARPAANSFFFYYYQTPTPATAMYMGIFVQAPGLVGGFSPNADTPGVQVGSQTTLKFKLGQNAEWFGSATNNFMIVIDLGKRFTAGGNTACRLQLRRVVTPTAQAATSYAIPLSSFIVSQDCGGAATTVAQALAASPVSQIAFQGVGGTNALSDGTRTSGGNLTVRNGDGRYPTTLVLEGGITID